MDSESRTRWIGLGGWLALCFIAAAVGTAGSLDARPLYAALALPRWAPPGGAFGPVWTALYLLMGVAAWRVWWSAAAGARPALTLFLVQLALNALWSWLFFAWRLGGWALLDIVVLWLMIAATLAAFARIDRVAGALLVPYLAWVGFAACLNFAVWRMNPALLT